MSMNWWSVEDVCKKFNLSRYQVYRRIQSGQIPARLNRSGKLHYLIADADVQRYIAPVAMGDVVGAGESPATTLRVPDVAAMLGFTAETVRDMCARGDLAHVRGAGAKGHYRIFRSSVEEYVASTNATP